MRKREKAIDHRDDVARDGEFVRVPLMLADSMAGHRPGYWVRPLDAEQVAAFDARRRPSDQTLSNLDTARDAARAARAGWIADMCSAWKRPPTHDASEPDAAEQLLARHLRGKPDDDAATHREKGYADYKARLEGAW